MERLYEIKFDGQDIDVITMLIKNELEYYERKEDMYQEDYEYIEVLKGILEKINKEVNK